MRVPKEIEIVMHLAAIVGGIKCNMAHPGTMFRDNILINTNMLEAARINAEYGWAKRMREVQAMAYAKEFGV